MPPLSARFASMQDFYRFHFLSDGYPGRAEPDGTVFAHPIYGTYVLADYAGQLERQRTAELESALRTVAHAAVDRMEDHRGALAFWYDADPVRSARLYERHYSGLTQGYYAVELYRAGTLLGDTALLDAAERTFASLLVPVQEGGVYFENARGSTICEVPQHPNSWILNGWMSSLASVRRYAELSGSAQAQETFAASALSMADLLPLFDDPALRTSLYGLTGFTYLRLVFDTVPTGLEDLVLVVPGEADVQVAATGVSRWQTFVLDGDMAGTTPTSRTVRLNAVLSIATVGGGNALEATVVADRPVRVVLEGMKGEYDPRSSAPVRSQWVRLDDATTEAARHRVRLAIGDEIARAAAYPTNFVKEIDGLNVNIYHGVHIRRLREIGAATGIQEMLDWADTWADYVDQWPSMSIYEGLAMRDFRTGRVTPLSEWQG
ncbi:MAG: D-glucuronyl C5-epimerase family protein [Actinomycetales bacterium]|nr:D-glucuronyl C5-epimerase family protein [Actinomycetales bacterium]